MSEGKNRVRTEVDETFSLPLYVAAAHELKSPLALMRQLSLALESDDLSPEEIKKVAQRIRLTSERSLRLAQDLSLSQRLEDGLFELEPINATALCEEVAYEMAPLFAARERELRVRRQRKSPLIVANRTLLRSILMQFTDNALQYSEKNRPIELMTTSSRDGNSVRISVRDYGPAMSLDMWRRLQNISKGPQSIARRPGSSGLGLYVAGQFASVMQANVGITRHRDGASFYLDIVGSTQMSLL